MHVRNVIRLKNVPPELKETDAYLYGQVRNTFVGLTIVIAILCLYSLSYLFLGNMPLMISNAADLVVALGILVYFVRDPVKRKVIASNMTIAIVVATSFPTVLATGGIESSSIIWYALFPAVMVFMNGVKNAAIWFILTSATLVSLFVLHEVRIDLFPPGSSSAADYFLDTSIMAFTTIFSISAVDVSKRRTLHKLEETQAKLRVLATTDPLTGLFNRAFLIERAEAEINRALRYNTPLAALMVDLDHFKAINDNYGHQVGDRVLEGVSVILRNSLRGHDLIGRYGGEEFIVILPESSIDQAMIVSERMRVDTECAVMATEDGPVRIRISVGVAELPVGREPTLDALIQMADKALYHAKRNGRNRVSAWNEQM